ncbi:MAG: type II toxin-antitoxin system Phd/YefM family antitoxin [Cyanobacteria bacterium J06638_22]
MPNTTVSSTEFQTRAGQYIDEAGKAPVFITKHNRPLRVLVDVEEYERLKSLDTRHAYYPEEMPDHLRAELEKGFQGEATPDLDHLME